MDHDEAIRSLRPNTEDDKKDSNEITPVVSVGVSFKEDIDKESQTEKQKAIHGDAHFHRLGWKRLTVILIVEAIALGSLSLPSAFATLGMVAGVILSIGVGLVAIYTSYIIGQVKLRHPHVAHYIDIGRLLMGNFGYHLFSVMFVLQLTLLVGSHCLTGKIAFASLTEDNICSLFFSIISAAILFLLAIPPSFTEVAILGYIDFASILLAIGITMIATGIQRADVTATWSLWPKAALSFTDAFIAVNNIVFAYAFAVAQPSFMDEMHTPEDFIKSIWTLGIAEITIYTLTGAIIYSFSGQEVQSPALLSAGPLITKIAFGVALPVIFISGSINTTVVCRYIHGKIYKDSITRYINTKKGWITWVILVFLITLLAWVVAEAIPFFSELLSICSSLFVSGFSFYFPPVMWFLLLKDGAWYSRRNLLFSVCNGFAFIIGIIVLGCGTYASIVGVIQKFRAGTTQKPFMCT